MGKASRTKRERREAELTHQSVAEVRTRQVPVFWLVVGALVIGVIVALVATRPDERERAAARAGERAPTFAAVDVQGAALPSFTSNDANDGAVGTSFPTLNGTGIDGKSLTLSAGDGAQVLVVFAHWCPHCNAELPRIVSWARDGNLPAGVSLRGISTAVSKAQPNFPPATWLQQERWTYPTLVDDEVGTAAEAMGVVGFPFLVFVDSDGTVVQRYSGEMPIGEFDRAVNELA